MTETTIDKTTTDTTETNTTVSTESSVPEPVAVQEVKRKECTHDFFFILSSMVIRDMKEYFSQYGVDSSRTELRVIHDRKGRETNKTVAYLNVDEVKRLPDNVGLKIFPFKITERTSREPYQSRNFYLPRPSRETDVLDLLKNFKDKMKIFVETGLINDDEYSASAPVKSRVSGELLGTVFCINKDSVPDDSLEKIRFLLDFSEFDNGLFTRVLWANDRRGDFLRAKNKDKTSDVDEEDDSDEDVEPAKKEEPKRTRPPIGPPKVMSMSFSSAAGKGKNLPTEELPDLKGWKEVSRPKKPEKNKKKQ